jgi:coenzyme F420-0:L-glutamate ligase
MSSTVGPAPPQGLRVLPVTGIGEVRRGDDLAAIVVAHASLEAGDVVVVTQKVVSKVEGRMVELSEGDASERRRIIASESVRTLRRRDELAITETRHGFVCANAGVDVSNVDAGWAALLPVDPDRSARRIRDGLRAATGFDLAVVVTDTFGRPWRKGVTDVAIGCAGIGAVEDLRGSPDANGRTLEATEVCVVDEIAAAADLVMRKAAGIPVAVVRGLDPSWFRRSSVAEEVVRPPGEDLFR